MENSINHSAPRTLMTAREVMHHLKISRETLHNYTEKGLITVIRLSTRKHLFDAGEINRIACYGIPQKR